MVSLFFNRSTSMMNDFSIALEGGIKRHDQANSCPHRCLLVFVINEDDCQACSCKAHLSLIVILAKSFLICGRISLYGV